MERKVRARTHHKCDACEEVIKPTEFYILQEGRGPVYSKETHFEEQSGIEYYRYKTCLDCYERRDLDCIDSMES